VNDVAVLMILGLLLVSAFVFVGLPTLVGAAVGRGLLGAAERKTVGLFARDMESAGEARGFNPSKTFVWAGGSIAFDIVGNTFYIASLEHGRIRSSIYPTAGLMNYSSGHDYIGKHQKFFVDVTIDDLSSPVWRLWFGGDHRKMAELTSTIDVVWRRSKVAA